MSVWGRREKRETEKANNNTHIYTLSLTRCDVLNAVLKGFTKMVYAIRKKGKFSVSYAVFVVTASLSLV
jgi:hypothetical protein